MEATTIPIAGNRLVWPRGRRKSKYDIKQEASSLTLQESLKELITMEEVSSGKRGGGEREERYFER
jgi:hypothetical protein